jgi:hypothetical protein
MFSSTKKRGPLSCKLSIYPARIELVIWVTGAVDIKPRPYTYSKNQDTWRGYDLCAMHGYFPGKPWGVEGHSLTGPDLKDPKILIREFPEWEEHFLGR